MRRRDILFGAGALAFPMSSRAAFALAAPQKHILKHRVEDFGAKGDGVTDDAAAFRASAAAGVVCHLRPGANYALGSRVTVGSHAGFIGGGGGADVFMLTSTRFFDLSSHSGPFGANHVGFYALNAMTPVLENLRVRMQPTREIRSCIPFAVRGCRQPSLAVEIFGFKESFCGLVAWDSNEGGDAEVFAHDCGTNSTTLPQMQVSAIEIDNNRINRISSEGWRVRLKAHNLSLGPDAVARYGCQTDGLTVMSEHTGGTVEYIDAISVAEPLDCWGDGVIVKSMRAKNIEHFAIKLIYGASNCHISNVIVDGTGLSAINVSGHSSDQRPFLSTGNRIEGVDARNVGALLPRLGRMNPKIYKHPQPGFYIDGNQAKWQPEHTYISGSAYGFSKATMSCVGSCSSTGPGNRFDIDGDVFADTFFKSSGGSPVVRRRRSPSKDARLMHPLDKPQLS